MWLEATPHGVLAEDENPKPTPLEYELRTPDPEMSADNAVYVYNDICIITLS